MESMPSEALSNLLMHQFRVSETGIAALDAHNVFLFNNAAFADMFGFSGQSMQGLSHDDMMAWVFQNRVGPIIGCPTLEGWLAHVQSRLRSATFRRFEVDLHDGRWLLVTEQVHPTGELMMLCSDITQQKKVEFALKQTQSDLERLALTDELTAIPNRRHFLQQLGQEFTRARRHGHPLCLAMLDLDHFKRVNDRFGHLGGDEVLKHFATFLRQQLRSGDILGRLGGEEFAILLPETQIEDALCVLRRIGTELGAQRMDLVAPGFAYTFSGGIVEMPDDTGIDYSWMLASADKALYDAKSSGRNRITPFVPLGT
jgi:diguanylate cyclase (GGDEF)-like protein